MARTPKNIVTATLATTTLTEAYEVPAGINASSIVLTFTNATTANTVNIYRGTFLQETLTLPAGSATNARRRVFNMHGVVNATDTVSIQLSVATAINYSLSASEVEI